MASSEAPFSAGGLTLLLALSLFGCGSTSAATRPSIPAFDALALQSTRGEVAAVSTLLSRADASVFVFWSAGCPCVVRYQARIDALAAQWSSRGVQFVEVASNAGESLESLQQAAQDRHLVRALWRDEGGQLAKALQARSTPTVVLVRRDGTVLYRGWVDNERLPGEDGREAWLESALTAFATGTHGLAKSPTWGCTITKSLSPTAPIPSCHVPPAELASSSPGGSP